jgi:hypothetical protein
MRMAPVWSVMVQRQRLRTLRWWRLQLVHVGGGAAGQAGRACVKISMLAVWRGTQQPQRLRASRLAAVQLAGAG